MITCSQCREELAEYALGQSTTPAAAVEHLRACSVCRRELQEIEESWSMLPLTLSPTAAPEELFRQIAARIDAGLDKPAATLPSTYDVPRGPGRRTRIASYALAASVLIGVSLAAWSRLRENDASDLLTARSSDELALEDLARRLGNLQQMERLLQSGNVRMMTVAARAEVEAYVVWDMSANQWHLYAANLPLPPAGKTYQLWSADDKGRLRSGAIFTVDDAGVGRAVVDVPPAGDIHAARAIVTLEPDGGSAEPTGEVALEVTL